MKAVDLDRSAPKSRHGIEFKIASLPAVQDHMDEVLLTARVNAIRILESEADSGDSAIQVERGITDRYLILSDERGQQAAAAIEYGRTAYNVVDANGDLLYRTKATDGLYVLHRALRMRVKKRKRVRKTRVVKR